MATFTMNNKYRAIIMFNDPDLKRYSIMAYVEKYLEKIFVNFTLPIMTFRHRDNQTAADIADGIQKAVIYACKQKGTGGNPRFIASTNAPVFSPDMSSVRLAVFEKKDYPYLDARVEEDGFIRWTIMGFVFKDDLPSAVRYVAALQKMPNYVRRLVQPR